MGKTKRLPAKYTNKTLMTALIEKLRENGCLPKELDYIHENKWGQEYELRNYEFENASTIDFGSNEGIYINFAIRGDFDGTGSEQLAQLGTAKTLLKSREGMRIMGQLLGDFTYELHQFVNSNIEDFTFVGYNVGTSEKVLYEVRNKDRVITRAKDILKKHGSAKVVNNATGQTWEWHTEDEVPEVLEEE